jgi:hypothetical protein
MHIKNSLPHLNFIFFIHFFTIFYHFEQEKQKKMGKYNTVHPKKVRSDEAKSVSKWEKEGILKFISTKMMSMKRRQQNERQTFVIEFLAVVNTALQFEGDRIKLREAHNFWASILFLLKNNISILIQMSTGERKTIVLNMWSICVLLLSQAKQSKTKSSTFEL